MSIKIQINRGWLYLTPIEKRCITAIIKELETTRNRDERLHTGYFQKKLKVSANTTAHALNILIAARILKPQQYGRMRLYSLIGNHRRRLKQITCRTSNE